MSAVPGEAVALAVLKAGFTDQAAVTIVAIGKRESGWDTTAQGDIGIQDATWGPSAGVFQIRTLKAQTGTGGDRDLQALIPGAVAGQPGSGRGDLDRQARAAFVISSGGANFTPWSTFAGISSADMAAANDVMLRAIGQASGLGQGDGGGIVGGIVGDVAGGLADAMDRALGAVLGYSGTFSEWAAMVVLRTLEVVAGGAMLAAALVMFLDVLGGDRRPASGAARGGSTVARSGRQLFQLAKRAAVVAAA